jgi:Na+-transporting methylmalonyl-CoA/oxaloacetate decarboxylase gamma subunit
MTIRLAFLFLLVALQACVAVLVIAAAPPLREPSISEARVPQDFHAGGPEMLQVAEQAP